MAIGTRRKREREQDLWIATSDVVEAPGNAFYDRLKQILDAHQCDAKGRAALPEVLQKESVWTAEHGAWRSLSVIADRLFDSERGIAWPTADSLSLRKFLGYALDQATPDLDDFANSAAVLARDP